jgi:hypothetical protein
MASNDTKIKKVMELLEKQKADLVPVKLTFNTHALYKANGKVVNLNVVNSKQELIMLLAECITFKDSLQKAKDMVGSDVDSLIDGFTIDDWIHDVKLKYQFVEFKDKQKSIKLTEKKLEQLLSEDARTEIELDSIMDSFDIKL